MNNWKRPFLSIITINYNNKIGLEKTVRSVLCQSFKDYEYIIIDGGSNDGSKQYLELQNNLFHFWVSEPDNGIYNAMNKGIKVANGEYLLFLNSGDFLNDENSLKDFIKNEEFYGDIIYGDYKFEEGFKIFPDHLTPLFFARTSLPHQSTFFKRDVFEEMGNYNESYKIVSDREFYIKCFLSNKFTFKHINLPLTVYDLAGVSNNPVFKVQQALENDKMFQEYYGIFYQDYKNMIVLQNTLNHIKKKTISGLLKRMIYKIKKYVKCIS